MKRLIIIIILVFINTIGQSQINAIPKWRVTGIISLTNSWFYGSKERKFHQMYWDIFAKMGALELSYLARKRYTVDMKLIYVQKRATSHGTLGYQHDYITTSLTGNYSFYHHTFKPFFNIFNRDVKELESWSYIGLGVFTGYMIRGTEGGFPILHENLQKWDSGVVVRYFNQYYRKDNRGNFLSFNIEYSVQIGLTKVLDYKIITLTAFPIIPIPSIRISYVL